jgi:hypothetical protein
VKQLLSLAALSSVYLLYLPHAAPVLDDWVYLQLFDQPGYLRGLLDNSHPAQFRLNWAGLLPVYLLSRAAGASAWPYALLAWAVHLLTGFLLGRLVAALAEDQETGFAAAALYAVLPAANQALFWSLATSFYSMQTLGLVWFLLHPRLRCLPAVLFLGEQAIPALLLLPGIRAGAWRRWALAAALLAGYALLINRMPVVTGLQQRAGGVEWSLWPLLPRILDTLWRSPWQWHPLLIAAVVPALAVLLLRRPPSLPARRPHLRLLLWSLGGVLLTYLPISWLALEWRYLYVPALFLASGAASVLGLLGARARAVLLPLAALYCVCTTFQEMRQCWVPQSRVARALIRTLAGGGPYHDGEVVLFSGGPGALGPAPNFITGAGFALRSVVARHSPNPQVRAARELILRASGEPAWYPDDVLGPFSHADLDRLRIFAWQAGDRYEPRCWIAWPVLRPLCADPGLPSPDRIYTPHRVP